MKLNALSIENTTFCQANCTVCVRDRLRYELSHMPQELFEKSVKEAAALYKKEGGALEFIDFGGMGEPTMDPGLEEKLRYLDRHYPEIRIGLTTNAQLLMAKKEILCRYVDVMKISNYGFTKESFESIHRGSLVYEDVRQVIEEFLAIPLGDRPKVIMSFLMLPENAGEENSWKDHWEGECEEIYIWRPHNWAGYKDCYTMIGAQSSKPKSCGRPGREFIVRANGDVSACCWDFNRELSVGNLYTDTFEEILNGEKLRKIVEMHRKKNFLETDTLCARCDQIYDRADALIYSSVREFKVGNGIFAGDIYGGKNG